VSPGRVLFVSLAGWLPGWRWLRAEKPGVESSYAGSRSHDVRGPVGLAPKLPWEQGFSSALHQAEMKGRPPLLTLWPERLGHRCDAIALSTRQARQHTHTDYDAAYGRYDSIEKAVYMDASLASSRHRPLLVPLPSRSSG
jgi:hypothetical protein